jgi:hypothetical protein
MRCAMVQEQQVIADLTATGGTGHLEMTGTALD